jgi:diguanylate cyclase (GGDEF)-like protein
MGNECQFPGTDPIGEVFLTDGPLFHAGSGTGGMASGTGPYPKEVEVAMSVSITDKTFRRVFISFFLLSCMMPLLMVIFMVYHYTVPLLGPFQLDELAPVFSAALSGVILFQVLGFFLLWWWVNSLEKLTGEIEEISCRHLPNRPSLKGIGTNELKKINTLVQRLNEELKEKMHQVDAYASQVRELTARLAFLSCTDELTQLYNQKYFEKKLSEATQRAKKIGMAFWLVRFEVNHFSSFGEKNGDQVLRMLGRLVKKILPATALPFRIGRNEFAVIIGKGDGRQAARTIHALSTAVAAYHFRDGAGLPIGKVSISCGIAGFKSDPETLRVDAWRALVTAQQNGRPIEVAAAA